MHGAHRSLQEAPPLASLALSWRRLVQLSLPLLLLLKTSVPAWPAPPASSSVGASSVQSRFLSRTGTLPASAASTTKLATAAELAAADVAATTAAAELAASSARGL